MDRTSNHRKPSNIVTPFGNSGSALPLTESPKSDFDAGRLQSTLKKAIAAINNFDWTGLRPGNRVPCTAAPTHEELELHSIACDLGVMVDDGSTRDNSDMA